MYLGRIFELAGWLILFAEPHHPCTRALLPAVPVPGGETPTHHPDRQRTRPDQSTLRRRLSPPCPFLRPVGDRHTSACHLDHVPGSQVLPAAA
jgi:ABC-type oligopeptide transport system ATPase subunit